MLDLIEWDVERLYAWFKAFKLGLYTLGDRGYDVDSTFQHY